MIIEISVTVITVLVGLFLMNKYQKAKEKAAEKTFKTLMSSLEEKAKREGTFNASYFD